jgi:hypothetical protein
LGARCGLRWWPAAAVPAGQPPPPDYQYASCRPLKMRLQPSLPLRPMAGTRFGERVSRAITTTSQGEWANCGEKSTSRSRKCTVSVRPGPIPPRIPPIENTSLQCSRHHKEEWKVYMRRYRTKSIAIRLPNRRPVSWHEDAAVKLRKAVL